MNNSNCANSTCRRCRFYIPQGRRGGQCDRLNIAVFGGWKACAFVMPPFAPSLEKSDVVSPSHPIAGRRVTPFHSSVTHSSITHSAIAPASIVHRFKLEALVSESCPDTVEHLHWQSSPPPLTQP